jgi:hypothetical protein
MTDDYYELLGVPPDASREEIRSAYREQVEGLEQAQKAQLNRAWNVLSDQAQRDRYDERRAAAAAAEGDEEGAEERLPVAAPSGATGARGARSAKAGEPAKGGLGRPAPEPTVILPAGMHIAEKKARGLSIGFDFAVVLIIYMIGLAVILPMLQKREYPDKVDRIDAITKCIDYNNSDSKSPKRPTDPDFDCKERAGTSKARDKTVSKLEDQVTNLQGDMISLQYLVLGGVFVVSLLYLVPMTALTGQSMGKRLRKLWLVRVDGSRAGWGSTLAHYVPPLAIAIALPQLGGFIALGLVFWALRDRNGQGIHDKLARTLVVDAPPAA